MVISIAVLVLAITFEKMPSTIVHASDPELFVFQDKQPPPQEEMSGRGAFELVGSGRLAGKDIASGTVSVYKAPDGTLLHHYLERYHSPAQAEDAMKKRIQKAKKVLEQGTKSDNSGKPVVGERVILSTPPQTSIVRRDGVYLYEISSTKLADALALERQLDQSRLPRANHSP